MKHVRLKKGYDIRLDGDVSTKMEKDLKIPDLIAVKPIDFTELKEKMLVSEGESVKIGTPLFYAKQNERIKFVSTVSGIVKEIRRGERRKVTAVIVENNKKCEREEITIDETSRENIVESLCSSGLFPLFRQRPFHKIANPDDLPRDIFISGFDTAPLATDQAFLIHENRTAFQYGINILKKLTNGKIYFGINDSTPSDITGVENVKFTGPHPSGNVGVQIHHISPIKGRKDLVWTINVSGVIKIGLLFSEKKIPTVQIVKVAGTASQNSGYFKIICGSILNTFCSANTNSARFISGNPLTGTNEGFEGFLGFYDDLVSILPEPKDASFLGWISPGFGKETKSRTLMTGFLGKSSKFDIPTAINGGQRAFIASGIYEDVLPMDILPVYLMKSILAEDVEEMEALGIYEVAEEDIALCEFICPSKIEWQEILRNGLIYMEKEA